MASASRNLIDLLRDRGAVALSEADADAFDRSAERIAELERVVDDFRQMTIHEFLALRGVSQVTVEMLCTNGEAMPVSLDPRSMRFHAGSIPLPRPDDDPEVLAAVARRPSVQARRYPEAHCARPGPHHPHPHGALPMVRWCPGD